MTTLTSMILAAMRTPADTTTTSATTPVVVTPAAPTTTPATVTEATLEAKINNALSDKFIDKASEAAYVYSENKNNVAKAKTSVDSSILNMRNYFAMMIEDPSSSTTPKSNYASYAALTTDDERNTVNTAVLNNVKLIRGMSFETVDDLADYMIEEKLTEMAKESEEVKNSLRAGRIAMNIFR